MSIAFHNWWSLVSSNVIDRYRWDVSYEGQDSTVNPFTAWFEANNQVAYLINTALGSGPIANGIATTPLNPSALPVRMVDRAVYPDNAAGGFTNSAWNWVSSNFHYRSIVFPIALAGGDRFFQYVVSGTRLAELRVNTATQIGLTVRYDASGGIYTGAPFGLPTGVWWLIDGWVSGNQMGIYVNGVDYSPAPHGTAVPFAAGPDSIGISGNASGGAVLDAFHLFHGWRWNQTISLAEHQADALALGL